MSQFSKQSARSYLINGRLCIGFLFREVCLLTRGVLARIKQDGAHKTLGTWLVFSKCWFSPCSPTHLQIVPSALAHAVDGTTRLHSREHTGGSASARLPHCDSRRESEAGSPNIGIELTFCLCLTFCHLSFASASSSPDLSLPLL